MNSGAMTLSGSSSAVWPFSDSGTGVLDQPDNSAQVKVTRPTFIPASSRLTGMEMVALPTLNC